MSSEKEFSKKSEVDTKSQKNPSAGERRALERAVLNRDVQAVQSMLASGMPPDVAHGGVPPLFLAATSGSPEMIDVLVSAGADPNRILVGRANGKGESRTALNAACRSAHIKCASHLLDHGADPSIPDDEGRNAAHLLLRATDYARYAHQLPQLCVLLRRMLDLGTSVDTADSTGATIWRYALLSKLPLEGLELLIERGANVVLPDSRGVTPLQLACVGNPSAIALLVRLGADLEHRMPDGRSLLHLAIEAENLDAVLACEPDLEARDANGRTALLCALADWASTYFTDRDEFPWKAERLIGAGANLETADNDGLTSWRIIEREGIAGLIPTSVSGHGR